MITCGRTSLVCAITEIFTFIDPEEVSLLIYERKNEHRPEAQHSQFEEDVARLRCFFTGKCLQFGDGRGHFIRLFHYENEFYSRSEDMTLELLMHDLSEPARKLFSSEPLDTIYRETDIHNMFGQSLCDDYLFSPMGYSANGLVHSSYYTFHVTPEPIGSYASFETNLRLHNHLEQTISRVLKIFDPASFTLLLFERNNLKVTPVWPYECCESIDTLLCGYRIHFRNFKKNQERVVDRIRA